MAKDTLERVLESIQWLEHSAIEKFSLNEMASIACLSPYHFSRVFSSLTGMPPVLYHRRRVLTKAAHRLLESNNRILDIALDSEYESHEAFTRAFKKVFKTNPDDLKKQNKDFSALYQKPITEDFLKHFEQKGVTIEPAFKECSPFKVSGVSQNIEFDDLEEANDVWLEYFKSNKKDKDQYYGICQGTYEGNIPSSQLLYTAGHSADQGIEVGGGRLCRFHAQRGVKRYNNNITIYLANLGDAFRYSASRSS